MFWACFCADKHSAYTLGICASVLVFWDFVNQKGVSKNRGTPKWMVYNGKPYQNGWFGGTIISVNTQKDQPRKNLLRWMDRLHVQAWLIHVQAWLMVPMIFRIFIHKWYPPLLKLPPVIIIYKTYNPETTLEISLKLKIDGNQTLVHVVHIRLVISGFVGRFRLFFFTPRWIRL